MIIVSQNKETIVNFNTVDFIEIVENRDNFGIEANFAHTTVSLGNYFKQNRAKEVLQEIIKAYRQYRTAECDGYTNVLEETAVYEMPKE